MKKNPLTGFAFKKSERWKIFLIMRLTMILLVGFIFGASANSLGQYQMKVYMGETTYEELFREIRKQTVDQMVDQIMTLPERQKIQLLAPVVRGRKQTT